MKQYLQRSRFVRLVLASIMTLLTAGGASAQSDSITITPHKGPYQCSWVFSVKNSNSQSKAINNVALHILSNDGTVFSDGGSADQTWSFSTSPDGLTQTYTASGASILSGNSLGGFNFGTSAGIDLPELVQWTTYNNTTVLSTGTLYLICTPFLDYQNTDSVSCIASRIGTDPCFQFKVFNNNDAGAAITDLSFETIDPTAGTIRPSYLRAPANWTMDSCTPNRVYYHSETANIDVGRSLDSFVICMRANPSVTHFNWVARLNSAGALIDRDTIRNIATSGTNNSTGSDDSVFASKSFGCVYGISLANYHAQNLKPPSRLTGMTLSSTTAGVTFANVTSTPLNWAKSISAHSDSIIFRSANDSEGLASGVTLSTFGLSMNNPSGGAFTIHWQTFRNGAAISNGDLALTCAQGAAQIDSAILGPGTGTCCYKLTVHNGHNTPPSNLSAVSLAITDGSGTFDTANLASTQSWNHSASPTASSIRFTAQSSGSNPQASGTSQDFLFCVNPKKAGQPVNILWQSYDATNTAIEPGQPIAVTCSPVSTTCDSVWYTTESSTTCLQNFGVLNRRTEDVTKVVISPLNGWKVDTAIAPFPWTPKIDPTRTFVTFSSSQGIPTLSPQDGLKVAFSGTNTSNTFGVVVATTNSTSTCSDTLSVTSCTATMVGVAAQDAQAYTIRLAVNPNPFTNSTDVTLTMPVSARSTVELLDVLGRSIRTLASGELSAGAHVLHIDSNGLAAGTYYVRVQSLVGVATRKIVLSR